jgi:hypothetical protein
MGCLNSTLNSGGKMVPDVPANLSEVVTAYSAKVKDDNLSTITVINGRFTGPGKAHPVVKIDNVTLDDTSGTVATKKVSDCVRFYFACGSSPPMA